MREITGTLYLIKTCTGRNIFVETSDGEQGFEELCEFCASKEARGYNITSVVEIERYSAATPRVSVLSSKQYKAALKKLREEEKK